MFVPECFGCKAVGVRRGVLDAAVVGRVPGGRGAGSWALLPAGATALPEAPDWPSPARGGGGPQRARARPHHGATSPRVPHPASDKGRGVGVNVLCYRRLNFITGELNYYCSHPLCSQ